MTEPLQQARVRLEQVRELLMAPALDHLDLCASALESAVEQMALLNASPQARRDQGGAPLRHEIEAFRRDLITAGALFEHAGEFHRGWGVAMGLANSGYTADGGLAAFAQPERIAVQG